MAMPKAGVSLVVENDQQFKAALSEVNAGLKVNKQQMQLVTEQTREMDDRQAALKQRYEAAQQTLQSYRDKVQVLQQAYENSARREGEASKTTMQWRASLISAQTEVAKQESLLRDLSSEQEMAVQLPEKALQSFHKDREVFHGAERTNKVHGFGRNAENERCYQYRSHDCGRDSSEAGRRIQGYGKRKSTGGIGSLCRISIAA